MLTFFILPPLSLLPPVFLLAVAPAVPLVTSGTVGVGTSGMVTPAVAADLPCFLVLFLALLFSPAFISAVYASLKALPTSLP